MFWWYKMRLSAGEKCFVIDTRVATVKAWLAGNSDIILKQPFTSHPLVSHSRLWRLQGCSALANAQVEVRSLVRDDRAVKDCQKVQKNFKSTSEELEDNKETSGVIGRVN